jgi:molybdate transport system ATP-binding protein
MSADSLSVSFRHSFGATDFDIAFTAPAPGVTALFGPSGSGKSTTVLAIAGLFRPDAARIVLPGGEVVADTARGVFVPPEHRRIGLVFQDARLFPHLSVRANLRYGQRRNPAGTTGFDDVVDLLGIGALLGRRPHTLSGGERQRVAIGRALLSQPRLLALDEPLASLDDERRAEILPYLARLRTALRLPMLLVSHDLREVARLADTLVLIRAGRVLAAGPLPAIAARADLPLATRDDAAAVLDARVLAHDPPRRLTRVQAAGREWLVPLRNDTPGTALRLRVPAREVVLATIAPAQVSVQNTLAGTVGAIVQDAPAHVSLVEIDFDGASILARLTPDAVERLALARGTPVLALIKSVALEIMD